MNSTPTVKGRQVKRYYRLLVRLGFDKVFDAVDQAEAASAPLPSGPTRPGELVTIAPASATTTVSIDLDFGDVFRACAGEVERMDQLSALDELAAAVLDLDDDVAAAGEWSVDDVAEGYGPFVDASARLLKLLMQPRFGQA